MVLTCCAYGCNEKFDKNSSTTFHSFPKDPMRRKEWTLKVRRKDFVPGDYTRICSKHFTEDCFDKERFGGTWLKQIAVPSIFDFPPHLQEKVSIRKPHHRICPSPPLLSAELPELAASSPLSSEKKRKTNQLNEEAAAYLETPQCKRLSYIGDFKPGVSYSPSKMEKRWSIAQKVIETQKRKICHLQQKTRRLTKKVTDLSVLLDEIKKKGLITEDVKQTLELSLPETAKQLLKICTHSSSREN